MKIFKRFALLTAVALGFVACASEVDNSPARPTEQIEEVGFAMAVNTTRTAIGEDGRTTDWVVGDKLAVWAMEADGGFALENTQFTLRYFSGEYDKAFFTSNIAEMAEGNYTYMLSYPIPASGAGTEATYTLPAEQTGKYEGRYDIMIAEPVAAEALTSAQKVDSRYLL